MGTPRKTIPWHVRRVEIFLSSRSDKQAHITDQETHAFLEGLEKNKEDWQVEQARDAIRVYRHLCAKRA